MEPFKQWFAKNVMPPTEGYGGIYWWCIPHVELTDVALEREAFDLVHAGLVLEYLEWPLLLPRVATTLKSGGVLSVVLQLPSTSSPAVTPTSFVSLQSLETLFRFVDPGALIEAARGEGLTLSNRRAELLPSGKAFEVLRFVKHAV